MLGFGKKKGNAPPVQSAGMRGPPTQKVLSMSSQGFSEPEIVKTLRQEGYTPIEVDRAIRLAVDGRSAYSNALMYLHKSCVPLDQAEFKPAPSHIQPRFHFGEMDCEGMCGM